MTKTIFGFDISFLSYYTLFNKIFLNVFLSYISANYSKNTKCNTVITIYSHDLSNCKSIPLYKSVY